MTNQETAVSMGSDSIDLHKSIVSDPIDNTTKPLISITIPVLNEEDNIDRLYLRLHELALSLSASYRFEFVFTDNHSQDTTWAKLRSLAEQDSRVRALRFSKNVGFQRSILANYIHTQGVAIFQLDADLQDPPELLASFLELWQQGYHVIYGIRKKRPEGIFITLFRKFGYWFIDKISEHPIPRDVGDFRLIDRKVIDTIRKNRSPNPYLRGLIASMGFKSTGIPYERQSRIAGYSKFQLVELIRLGMTGVFNHSVIPLRIATFSGLFLVALSFIGAVYFIILKFVYPETPRGITSILVLVLFGIGFQSLLLGVLGEYLLRIYIILRNDPIAVVENSLNFADEDIQL